VNASLRELNVKASELARRAEAGEVIIITDRGRPIADLGPHRTGLRFVRTSDVLQSFANLPPVDPGTFRDDLDAVVDPTFRDPDER
jgi:antitoxin (DNA-binding transcriptional repressor) of toxin-antitoxin stability system